MVRALDILGVTERLKKRMKKQANARKRRYKYYLEDVVTTLNTRNRMNFFNTS